MAAPHLAASVAPGASSSLANAQGMCVGRASLPVTNRDSAICARLDQQPPRLGAIGADVDLAGIVLPDARDGSAGALGTGPPLAVLSIIRHRY